MIGWIKLHRQIKDHWVYKNAEYLKAWITILIEVNHKPCKVLLDSELIECARGESLNSLSTWCNLFGRGWTIQRVRTFFKLLQNDSMIELKGLRKTTHLTVCKYDSYQDEQQTDNTQITHKQHTANRQITTNKNDKNVENDKNDKEVNYVNTFLSWFNNQKEIYTGKRGSFKLLNTNDLKNLKKLKESYTGEMFNTALRNMASNQWVKDTKNFNPSHFLRIDNFNRYLGQDEKQKPKLGTADNPIYTGR